ncbi:MAG: LamG domain-containing protein [Planctomycetota bacterium]|nr:LamG domain-containing protein [Planctomycetota bacterium]
MNTRVFIFFWILLLACKATLALQDAPKAAVPPALSQKEVLKEIQSIYKAEYARASKRSKAAIEAKRSLSKALLNAGFETKDDPATSYTLLNESRRLATESADVGLGLEALSLLVKRFDFNPQEMQLETFGRLAARTKSADDSWVLTHAVSKVVEDSIELDDYDTAQKFVKIALKTAPRSADKALTGSVVAQGKRAKLFGKLHSALEKRLKKLEGAERELELGRFYAFSKGDWKTGLPLLEKGDSGALGKLAAADAATERESVEVGAAVKLGDGWWEVAEKEKDDLVELNIKIRAGAWYELAVDELVPLEKDPITRRLTELRKLTKTVAPTRAPYLKGLVVSLNFDQDSISGEGDQKTCKDRSGYGHNGDFSGGKIVRGKVGGALSLNGAGERVVIAHTDKLHLTRGSSVSMWFRPNKAIGRGLKDTQVIFSKGYVERDLSYALLFSDEGDGTMTGIFTKRQYVNTSQSNWPTDKWSHVTLTLSEKDGDFTSRLYINGQLIDTDELGVDPEGTQSNISVGAMDTSGRRPFNGVVDELGVWDRPLSSGEVLSLYKDSSRGKSYCEAALR